MYAKGVRLDRRNLCKTTIPLFFEHIIVSESMSNSILYESLGIQTMSYCLYTFISFITNFEIH